MKDYNQFYKMLHEEQFDFEQLSESAEELFEALITFGGKAYPKFGNIVIMAGGAGSGKGFVLDKLVGIEGKTFDVDELKKMSAKSPLIRKRVKDEFGTDLEKLSNDLKDPENVGKLHAIIGDALRLPNRQQQAFFANVLASPAERKPNIIFDVTLKDLRKLEKLTRQASDLGYDKKNIHIVWVVNDIEVAKKQNLERDRVVPTEILINTHRGAQETMADIINMGKTLKRYMDGDIVFAFNKIKVDSTLVKNKDGAGRKIGMKKATKGGEYLKDAEYFYVKRAGKAPTPVDKLDDQIKRKIRSYVPRGIDWE